MTLISDISDSGFLLLSQDKPTTIVLNKLSRIIRKPFYFLFAFILILSRCGEAGVQSDVSKNIEIDPIQLSLEVPPALIAQIVQQTPPIDVNTGNINIGDEDFSEYLEDATNFTINQITYSVENFPADSQADLDVELDIQIQRQQRQDLLTTIVDDVQNNTSDVLLYSNGSPVNVSHSAIGDLEQALRNGDSFQLFMTIVGRDVVLQQRSVDFSFVFKFDVTARIELD